VERFGTCLRISIGHKRDGGHVQESPLSLPLSFSLLLCLCLSLVLVFGLALVFELVVGCFRSMLLAVFGSGLRLSSMDGPSFKVTTSSMACPRTTPGWACADHEVLELSVPKSYAVRSATNPFSLGHALVGHPQLVEHVATNLRGQVNRKRFIRRLVSSSHGGDLPQSVRVPLACHSKPWE
jgi:hypothetical protein